MKKPTRIAPTIEHINKQLEELWHTKPIDIMHILSQMHKLEDTEKQQLRDPYDNSENWKFDWETDGDKETSEIEKQELRDPYDEEGPKDIINYSDKDA